MRVQKVPRSFDRGKSAILYDHYVAIDWSLKTMAIGHMSRRDDHPRVFERSTDLKELKEYLGSLKGRTIITLEESGTAHWLYLELLDCVERIMICDPFHNRLLCHGPKTDKIDAGKLCELLRAGTSQGGLPQRQWVVRTENSGQRVSGCCLCRSSGPEPEEGLAWVTATKGRAPPLLAICSRRTSTSIGGANSSMSDVLTMWPGVTRWSASRGRSMVSVRLER